MKYVDMSNVAWDSSVIIFPGLNNCHGIVYATSAGLFGYHAAVTYISTYGQSGMNKIDAFIGFIKQHSRLRGSSAIGLYGLCPASRPTGDADSELRRVAEGMAYRGTIHTARWNTTTLNWGSTWVTVNRGLGQAITATIEQYENQFDTTKGSVVNADVHDQKMAMSDGTLKTLAETEEYAPTNAGTKMDFTDWGALLLPRKGKGIFTRG